MIPAPEGVKDVSEAHLQGEDLGPYLEDLRKTAQVYSEVKKVEEGKRQIWFRASGMYAGKDPYLMHAYRINFDGTGLTALTREDANHTVSYSSDMD